MSPDSLSPRSLKRAYSPPARSRVESDQPWWEHDRARAHDHPSTRQPDQLDYYGSSSSSSTSRQRDREYGPRGQQQPGGGWDRHRSSDYTHPPNGNGNSYSRGAPSGRGLGYGGGAGSYPHSRVSRSPPARAHQPLYPAQARSPPREHRPDAPLPPTAPASIPAPSPAPPPAPVAGPHRVPSPPAAAAEDGPEYELETAVERDPEEIRAERKRRTQQILAKYAAQSAATSGAGTPAATDTPGAASPANAKAASEAGSVASAGAEPAAKRVRLAGTESPEHATHDQAGDLFSLEKTGGAGQSTAERGEDVSAADYNPDLDRANDDRRKNSHGPLRSDHQDEWRARERAEEEKIKQQQQQQRTLDENDEDDDDMFAVDSKPVKKVGIEQFDEGESAAPGVVPMIDRSLDTSLVDEFDDSDGYYKLLLGEVLDNGRYHVRANLGKGMFASVVRAKDLHAKSTDGNEAEVAIKVIRSQESMYKAGQKEAAILRRLAEADPTDKKHLVRLLRTFEHRGHLCIVFESLAMNLREVVKRFGKDVGINLRAVRAYASQIFLALSLLRKCDIMHADLKPDNILVNESKSVLKVCDLGSASDTSENDITPYLVSRFYRAPEIILGLPYDPALDVWSIGCTLYELYTGKILFPGRSNNHMLQLIMDAKGKPTVKMLKKGTFTAQHFDEQMNFVQIDKSDVRKTVVIPPKPSHDLRARLLPSSVVKSAKDDELKLLERFVDLLDKMLTIDPAKRPTPKELLNHPFLRG